MISIVILLLDLFLIAYTFMQTIYLSSAEYARWYAKNNHEKIDPSTMRSISLLPDYGDVIDAIVLKTFIIILLTIAYHLM